jgi:membrane-associated protein
MSSFSDLLVELFRNYSTWFLCVIIILQCIGIPTGASLIVIASGAFAFVGEYNIVILLFQIWLFSLIGDSIAYFLWKTLGLKVINKSSRIKNYIEPKIEKSKIYLEKHGKLSVFLTRFFISSIGPFVNAAAGISGYSLISFVTFVAIGELIWAGMYLGLGYWFGDSWESIIPIVTQFAEVLTYITLIVICLYLLINTIKKKKTDSKEILENEIIAADDIKKREC